MGKGSGSGCGAFVHHRPAVTPVVKAKSIKLHPFEKPKGLINVGNTCYANAALQCLLSTALTPALLDPNAVDTFRQYSSNATLLSMSNALSTESCSVDWAKSFESGASDGTGSRKERRRKQRNYRKLQNNSQWLTRELTSMTKEYSSSPSVSTHSWWGLSSPTSVVINPANITRHPDKLSDCLRPFQQEDAHEFLRALLSTLTMNGHNTKLSSLFDGLLESAVTCISCRHSSLTRDRYMDLSLDISHQTTNTIVDALEEFTKTEVLDGDNCVYCAECKEKQQVTKELRLATAPSILVCHLKRFAFDKYGNLSRLSKRVEFPQQLLIGDYMSKMNKSKPPPYDLVGVLVHEGSSCEAGHYLAYVKAGGDWYKANDSVVQKVDLGVVLNQQAYVLLYEVAGMRHDVVMNDKKEGKASSKAAVQYSIPPIGAAPMESEATMTSSLMSLLCGVSEIHDCMLRDICWQRDSDDSGTVATECSADEDNSKRALQRKSNSSSNLQALETQASRANRASTLSPVRRERYNHARSLSNSAPGVRSPDHGSRVPPVKTKSHSQESPLPPRPKDYRRRHSSRMDA